MFSLRVGPDPGYFGELAVQCGKALMLRVTADQLSMCSTELHGHSVNRVVAQWLEVG